MIHPERVQKLNARPLQKGRFVLYWMQASQRAECNHALEYAVRQANEEKLPLITLFVLTNGFPEANLRHYAFMLEGLQEVKARLEGRGIHFVALKGTPGKEAVKVSRQASMVVVDRGYLRIQREWRAYWRSWHLLMPTTCGARSSRGSTGATGTLIPRGCRGCGGIGNAAG